MLAPFTTSKPLMLMHNEGGLIIHIQHKLQTLAHGKPSQRYQTKMHQIQA